MRAGLALLALASCRPLAPMPLPERVTDLIARASVCPELAALTEVGGRCQCVEPVTVREEMTWPEAVDLCRRRSQPRGYLASVDAVCSSVYVNGTRTGWTSSYQMLVLSQPDGPCLVEYAESDTVVSHVAWCAWWPVTRYDCSVWRR